MFISKDVMHRRNIPIFSNILIKNGKAKIQVKEITLLWKIQCECLLFDDFS